MLDFTDPEASYDFLRHTYADLRVCSSRHEGDYRMSVSSWACSEFSMDDIRHSTHLLVQTGPFPRETFLYLRAGRVRATADGGEYRWLPGDWGVYPSRTPIGFDTHPIDDRVVSLPAGALARVAATLGDDDGVRFTGWAPVSADKCRLWDTTVAYVHSQLAAQDSPLCEPLIRENMLDTLATVALTVFPNTTMAHVYTPGPGHTGARALRQALAFIEDNAQRPITISDIATAAGTTARAVQYDFARHLDTTPTLHLRRIRLERAHQELSATDPTTGTTVKQVAARWGFASPGTFAALYRSVYGTTPSHTLRS
ncbi:helix-turn-helix domain-containing protein [Streptomyces liliiviolaceus]|uniref:helix-turn-helix domain-containing protein n=1 Tax=Streptomyces liliiviolaceus TaxID=2823109 RepID=UPI001FFC6A82|nr:helix-turn-helix domain-containing protein [Streptomyces liliiviolaceus]